jgi:hypothetical protein
MSEPGLTASWEAHFQWSEDKMRVIGLTSTGRATVTRLRLNRPGVVNLRRVLGALGKHPPRSQPENDWLRL